MEFVKSHTSTVEVTINGVAQETRRFTKVTINTAIIDSGVPFSAL